jgi:hypothetical protein
MNGRRVGGLNYHFILRNIFCCKQKIKNKKFSWRDDEAEEVKMEEKRLTLFLPPGT